MEWPVPLALSVPEGDLAAVEAAHTAAASSMTRATTAAMGAKVAPVASALVAVPVAVVEMIATNDRELSSVAEEQEEPVALTGEQEALAPMAPAAGAAWVAAAPAWVARFSSRTRPS